MTRLRWKEAGRDALRSSDNRYWVSRAPLARGMVYTAAHDPESGKAVHLGCYVSSSEAIEACNHHAQPALIARTQPGGKHEQ